MRLVVVALSALMLTGCGGVFFSIGSPDTDAREFPILAAAMDCDVPELRRRAPTEHSTCDRYGMTALQWALNRNCDEGVMVLLEAGANPNPPDGAKGWSPVSSAASMGKLHLVKALVDRGADVNGRSIGSMMPIHSAAGSGALDVVRYLLSRGADPKATDGGGTTPLHTGARYPEMVRIFLDAGIDKNARTQMGAAPLAYAHDWPFATKRSGAAGARALLAAAADVNAADVTGQTPLMRAVLACDEAAALEMIRAGAQINASNQEGHTALQMSRNAAKQQRGFSYLLWSLLDPQAKEIARCREGLEQTLIAAGAE